MLSVESLSRKLTSRAGSALILTAEFTTPNNIPVWFTCTKTKRPWKKLTNERRKRFTVKAQQLPTPLTCGSRMLPGESCGKLREGDLWPHWCLRGTQWQLVLDRSPGCLVLCSPGGFLDRHVEWFHVLLYHIQPSSLWSSSTSLPMHVTLWCQLGVSPVLHSNDLPKVLETPFLCCILAIISWVKPNLSWITVFFSMFLIGGG